MPVTSALRVRNYRIYLLGGFVSNLGTWMYFTALAWLVLDVTGSGSALGVVLALHTCSSLVLSPAAGALADRYSKRRLMVMMQGLMVVSALSLGALSVSGTVRYWQICVLAFALGVGRALEAPARQAFLSELVGVDHVSSAVALNSASWNLGRLGGPGLGGLLIAALGGDGSAAGWIILFNALSFVATLLALGMLDATHTPREGSSRSRGSVAEGLRYVWGRPELVMLLSCSVALGVFGLHSQITSSMMADQEFGMGAGAFGVLGTVMALGSLSAAWVTSRQRELRLGHAVWAVLMFAAAQLAGSVMPTYVSFAVVQVLVGLSYASVGIVTVTILQTRTDPRMRGRVASLHLMAVLGTVSLGSPLIGWVSESFGPRIGLVTCGLGVAGGVAAGLLGFWLRRRSPRLSGAPGTVADPAHPG